MGYKRWWGDELVRLRRDYDNHRIPLLDVIKKHRTSANVIAALRRKHGWTPRKIMSPHLNRGSTLERMRMNVLFLDQTIARYTRERSQLEAKIAFLTALSQKQTPESG